jgi:DNA-directed RNA polymerase specialized sigma24 family protein
MSPEIRKAAMAQFLATEHKRLIGYVRRLIDDAADRDGEDIVQDVALSLFNRMDVLVPIEKCGKTSLQPLTDYRMSKRPW